VDFATVFPGVPTWRQSALPSSLEASEVEILIKHFNTHTGTGCRNFAIVLLLLRLGLRAIEVCRLTLEDIDWKNGWITIHSKSQKVQQLPMPKDVGEAIVSYLHKWRPQCADRHIFLRAVAPQKPFSGSTAITGIVRKALKKSGLKPKGAHLLRRTCATNLLRNGASLWEIGEILRHKSPETTMIYTKVDIDKLSFLAESWPGGNV
jgi:integrase